MKDNVVDMELEYFKIKNKEAYETLMNKEFDKVVTMLEEPIEKIESKLNGLKVYCPQNIFDASVYMNFLEPKATQKDFANINYYDFYLIRGAANYNLERFEEAKKDYKKAIEFNPTSSVARLQLLEIAKREKKFETYIDDIKELFKYAYRRVDMARAYRDLGYYLFEIKDCEMSIVAYYLSNAYEFTDFSMKEAMHIAEEADIDLESKNWLSEEMMGELYNKYKVPLLPSQELTKLSMAIAQDSYEKKAYGVSLFAHKIAYELTLDESLNGKIDELKDLVGKK